MKNVEILLFIYKEIIFGKVLYTKPRLIEKLDYKYYYGNIFISIISYKFPDLEYSSLYVWGDIIRKNNEVIYFRYPTFEEALIYFKGFTQVIKALNEVEF